MSIETPSAVPTLYCDGPGASPVGFPLLMALTIQTTAATRLGVADLLRCDQHVAIRVSHAQRGTLFEHLPSPSHDGVDGTIELPSGSQVRFLVDLSELLPATLPPDHYELSIGYLLHDGGFAIASTSVQWTARNRAQEQVFSALNGSRLEGETWGRWALRDCIDRSGAALPEAVDESMVLHLLVRRLLDLRHPPEFPTALAAAVQAPHLQPELAMLELEFAVASGVPEAIQRCVERVQRVGHGLWWWTPELGRHGRFSELRF